MTSWLSTTKTGSIERLSLKSRYILVLVKSRDFVAEARNPAVAKSILSLAERGTLYLFFFFLNLSKAKCNTSIEKLFYVATLFIKIKLLSENFGVVGFSRVSPALPSIDPIVQTFLSNDAATCDIKLSWP